jgi:DNA-binding transcriptional LysR family regulator
MSANAGEPIAITHRVNEFSVAAAIVAQTNTVCMLPRYTGLAAQFRDSVVLRAIDDLRVGRHISLLTRRDAMARTSIRTVSDWIRTVVRAQAPGSGIETRAPRRAETGE